MVDGLYIYNQLICMFIRWIVIYLLIVNISIYQWIIIVAIDVMARITMVYRLFISIVNGY